MVDIIIPEPNYHEFRLPSSGLWNGVVTLNVRALTLKDERLFLNKSLIKTGKIFDKILENVVKEKLDFSDMFVNDQNALLIFLRSISYGVDFKFTANCPYCGTSSEFTVNLEELPVRFASEVGITSDTKTIVLPITKKKVTLRYPRKSDADNANNIYDLIKRIVVSVEDVIPQGVPLFLENLVAGDVAEIRNEILKMSKDFGVNTEIKYICHNPDCESDGSEILIDIPVASPEFFRISVNRPLR